MIHALNTATRLHRTFTDILCGITIYCGFTLVLVVPFAAQADCTATTTAETTEIAAGIHVRQGRHGIPFEDSNLANISFVIGDNCIAVIDSGASVAEGQALKCAIKAESNLPICYLIVTHHHYDHAMGSFAFIGSAAATAETMPTQLIAHEKMPSALAQSAAYYRSRLAENPAELLPPEHVVMPTVTIPTEQSMTLDLGGRTLSLYAHKAAHTNNDLSVFESKTATLWMSDMLFVDHVPTLDTAFGTVNGWLQALDVAKSISASRAVPGHGPVSVSWPAGLAATQRYLNVIRTDIRRILEEGGTIEQAQQLAGQSEKPHWSNFDYHHGRTVLRAFTELEWE